jgi:hypothetical protein
MGKHKTWQDIEKEVETEMLERFASVPPEQRAAMGLEPGNPKYSHENRQWVQVYVQMLTWKNKCRELHEKAYPLQPVSPGNNKKKKSKK